MITINQMISSSVHFLRHHKEMLQNTSSVATFAIGIFEIYDMIKTFQGRSLSTEAPAAAKDWHEMAQKVIMATAKISLILSAATSRPGVFVISKLALKIFTAGQLNAWFGPNTIFLINPWHPRHVVSVAAAVIALPSIAYSAYRILCPGNIKPASTNNCLTDSKVRTLTFFVFMTSRPVLHLGNALSRRWVS